MSTPFRVQFWLALTRLGTIYSAYDPLGCRPYFWTHIFYSRGPMSELFIWTSYILEGQEGGGKEGVYSVMLWFATPVIITWRQKGGNLICRLNPNPIGLFWGLESIGGGGGGGLFWPPPQISATNGPIDLKIGTVVKQVK